MHYGSILTTYVGLIQQFSKLDDIRAEYGNQAQVTGAYPLRKKKVRSSCCQFLNPINNYYTLLPWKL